MKKLIFSILIGALLIYGCSKNPVTGRKQVLLFPESEMIGMSATAYTSFLNENQGKVLPQTDKRAAKVTEIGKKISVAVEKYLTEIGASDRVEGFEWTYNTVDDPTINAWCMPGGRIVFYTGILELMDNDDEIACVMGHEIGHAIARHGNERMTQGLALQGATTLAQVAVMTKENPTLTDALLIQSIGIGGQLGVLSFGRKQELESDKMGLIFMNMAGYDPYSAVGFWQKMSEQGGNKPPEFLSTHPSDERRIKEIEEVLLEMEVSGQIKSKSN